MPPSRIDESVAFVAVRIAVMTVSDTRDASNDTSGDTLAARIVEAGHVVAARALLRDNEAQIAAQLRRWIA
ncbi:MAG: molybdopterin-binding protein, partial [Rhizomicrobium sp.]